MDIYNYNSNKFFLVKASHTGSSYPPIRRGRARKTKKVKEKKVKQIQNDFWFSFSYLQKMESDFLLCNNYVLKDGYLISDP